MLKQRRLGVASGDATEDLQADFDHEASQVWPECTPKNLASVKLPMPRPSTDVASGSDGFSDFASVTSRDELFELGESSPVCATFALDDPTRDAAEERSGDTKSPGMLDLQDRIADDTDNSPTPDLSIDEFLLDLVNHVPPKFAQIVGGLLYRFEAVQRVSKPANNPLPGMDEIETPSGSTRTVLWHDDLDCRRHIEEYEQACSVRQEQLEQQFHDETAALASEARVLRDELNESKERFKIMQQLAPTDDELRQQEALHWKTMGAELETMSTALTSSNSKLIDMGVCLEEVTQHSEKFQDESSCTKLELRNMRLRSEDATARLQSKEDQRDHLVAEAEDMQVVERSLRSELACETHKRKEVEERLGMEMQDASERSAAAATDKAQLEVLRLEVEEASERLLSSQRIEEQLHEELANSHTAQEAFLAESASARVKSIKLQENLRQQVSKAEARAQQSSFELEHAEAELMVLQRLTAGADVLRRDLIVEQSVMEKVRAEAQAEEASLRLKTKLAEAETDVLRQQMNTADAAHSGSVSALASKLTSATAERDEYNMCLQQEHEQMLEQRMRTLVLTKENEELRACQENLRGRFEMQAQQEAAFANEITETHVYCEQREASKVRERHINTLSEMDDLRKERLELKQVVEEHHRTVAVVNDLIPTLREMDITLQQGRQAELSSAMQWERCCLERSCLEEELTVASTALSEERSLQTAAESESAKLLATKEKIQRRLKSAAAEIDRSKTREMGMCEEQATLRKALQVKGRELEHEINRARSQKVRVKDLHVARDELQSWLRLEGAAAGTVEPSSDDWSCLSDPISSILREISRQERERGKEWFRCWSQSRQSCSTVDVDESESHSPDDSWILSEQLKKVEEQGRIRLQQLEAEISLVEMDVVTLTKGLGRGAISGGVMGFGSPPPLDKRSIRRRRSHASRSTSRPHGDNTSGTAGYKPPPGGFSSSK